MFGKNYAVNYDVLNQKKPYKKEIDFVYKWAGKPRSIFDVGCGTASYWKHYPKDTKLVGIDRSRSMALVGSGRGIIRADITDYTPRGRFDCATALFDVLNYIPNFNWWENLPLQKDGLFIFDVWDKEKVDRDGFDERFRNIDGILRRITPGYYDGVSVELLIELYPKGGGPRHVERHPMFIHSQEDIDDACREHDFKIIDIKKTRTWQTWYKLKKR